MPSKYKVGILVGHALDNMQIVKNTIERPVTTIFGDPSNVLIECTIEGMDCALMSRESSFPSLPPNVVNHRANVWSLKEAGCTHIIDIASAGSLKEELKPGDFVMPDSFIDLTHGRNHTFYDGKPGSLPGSLYCPMNPPFSEPLRKHLLKASEQCGVKCADGGVVVTINGPRFSTKSESVMYQNLGGGMVNMVSSSDAILSKEAAMLCACIVIITGYDSWKEGVKVNQKAIKKQKVANKEKIEKLLAACIRSIGERDWDKEIEDLKREVSSGSGKCICKK